ncbi:MAG: DUF58 domain-containing protein [Spirochaetaceae bacterium]|nr:MAG: DUF58 domain-containing protein [Spirochaetaceae bacterium]
MRLRLHARSILIYLFAASILYLAAAYLGGPFPYAAALVVISGIFNLMILFVYARSISVQPDLIRSRVTRGECVSVGLQVLNEAPVRLSGWELSVRVTGPGDTGDDAPTVLADETFQGSVRASGMKRIDRTVELPHRGEYVVSRGPLTVTDALGWATVTVPVADAVVDVLPRADTPIPEIRGASMTGGTQAATAGGSPDFAMLRGLFEYRDGMPARHIAWRRLASTGIPYIRDYESSADPELAVFLDDRRGWADRERVLSSEDLLVETLLGIIKDLETEAIPFWCTSVHNRDFRLESSATRTTEELHLMSRNIRFSDAPRPLPRIRELLHAAPGRTAHVVVLTQMPDMELIRAGESTDPQRPWTILAVTKAWSRAQVDSVEQIARSASSNHSGGRVLTV